MQVTTNSRLQNEIAREVMDAIHSVHREVVVDYNEFDIATIAALTAIITGVVDRMGGYPSRREEAA